MNGRPVSPTPAGAGLGTRPRFPHVHCLCGRGAGVYADPTPTPKSTAGPKGTRQLCRRELCPAQPPGTGSGAPGLLRTWRAHTLIDTAPGLGEGGGGGCWGGTAEELGFGEPSLRQSRTKASARQLPSPADKGSGGRMSHPHCPPALSRPWARGGLNSAALSESGRTAHYHTAGLVNRPAGRKVRRAGVRSSGWAFRPGGEAGTHPWPCDPRAGHLLWRHRRLPGRRRQAPRAPACGSAPPPALTRSCCRAGTQAGDQPGPSHIKGSPASRAAPARMEPQRGWGRRGGARGCRRPPGPVGTRRNVPSSARPPAQRVPPVHPAWLSAQPGARGGGGGGVLLGAQAAGDPPPPCPPGPGCLLCANGSWGGSSMCRPGPPAPGRPGSSPPNPTPVVTSLGHRLSAKGVAGWLHPQPLHTHTALPEPGRHPGAAARTDTHQPPARSRHLGPGMPWEAGPARADAPAAG